MARPTRIDLPGAWYHVLNRDREAVDLPLTTSDQNAEATWQ